MSSDTTTTCSEQACTMHIPKSIDDKQFIDNADKSCNCAPIKATFENSNQQQNFDTQSGIGETFANNLTINCDIDLRCTNTKIINTDDEKSNELLKQNNGALLNINCDNINSGPTQPKPILTNNNNNNSVSTTSSLSRQQISKKSVSFDTDDQKIQKFITGEVIVDQQNPFKQSAARIRRTENNRSSNKTNSTHQPEEFVSTEDVLRESKFVKTYVKNPDKYFYFDPGLIKKLAKEEAEEIAKIKKRQEIPVKIARASKYSHERLKELKQRYHQQPRSVDTKTTAKSVNKSKHFDRSLYPDISQIRVKVGTDLEESLFNPDEVTLNAQKFDERIRNTSFGSQDDFDDIADLTSTSLESVIENPKSNGNRADDELDSSADKKDLPKKTFTNTVNSKEFQEYLRKKGLTLMPNSNKSSIDKSEQNNCAAFQYDSSIGGQMEEKKVKKPSVLQRLFPSRIFSTKRRTTPQAAVPEPKTLYTTSEEEISRPNEAVRRVILERKSFHGGSGGDNSSGLSMGLGYSQSSQQQQRYLKDGIVIDDGTSSISSALTNAEDFIDLHNIPTRNISHDNKESYIDMRVGSQETKSAQNFDQDHRSSIIPRKTTRLKYIEEQSSNSPSNKISVKPQTRIRLPANSKTFVPVPSERNRVNTSIPMSVNRSKQNQPVSLDAKSLDTNDVIVVKPRVHRPCIPKSNAKLTAMRHDPENVIDNNNKSLIVPVPVRRNIERQSLNYRKPNDENSIRYANINRVASLSKADSAKKRIPAKVPVDRVREINVPGNIPDHVNIATSKPTQNQHMLSTSRTPNSSIDASRDGPISTSTPIANPSPSTPKGSDFYFHKLPNKNIASPTTAIKEATTQLPVNKLELDTYSWAKLRELKEQTDRQLYTKPLTIQTAAEINQPHTVPAPIYGRRIDQKPENIYERLPSGNRVLMPISELYSQPVRLRNADKTDQQQMRINFQRKVQDQQRLEFIASQQNLLQLQPQPQAFVRNSMQRNTIAGGSTGLNVNKLREFQPIDTSTMKQHPQQYIQESNQQPIRCQSVLDNMITGEHNGYGIVNNNRLSPTTSVLLRRKQPASLSREEIMRRVTDFCRKSMNKTPTKMLQGSADENATVNPVKMSSSEISPNSYASLDSRGTLQSMSSNRSSAKIAPKVPLRVHSLQPPNGDNKFQSQSPIYAPIFRNPNSARSSVSDVFFDSPQHRRTESLSIGSGYNVNSTDFPVRQPTFSDSDSTFIDSPRIQKQQQQQQSEQQRQQLQYLTNNPTHRIDQNNVSALRQRIQPPEQMYGSRKSVEQYGRIHPKDSQYGYVQLKQTSQPVSQIYYPLNTTNNLYGSRQNILTGQLHHPDGRVTPLILHAIPSVRQHLSPSPSPMQMSPPIMNNNNNVQYAAVSNKREILYTNSSSKNSNENLYRRIVPIGGDSSNARSLQLPPPPPLPQPRVRQSLVRSGKYIVPYESCESTSEAEEVQRILRSRQTGKFLYFYI